MHLLKAVSCASVCTLKLSHGGVPEAVSDVESVLMVYVVKHSFSWRFHCKIFAGLVFGLFFFFVLVLYMQVSSMSEL